MATYLVTGAGSGIGAATAARMLARGDELVLLARNEDRAGELEDRFPGARTVVADLADPASLATTLHPQPLPDSLDGLVHSAGFVQLGPVAELTPDTWRTTLDVNLVAPAELTRLLIPALRAARGHVVLVNSGSGWHAGPEWSAYAASKHALRALAEALRTEERGYGVRVTSVYPGRVATRMQQQVHAHEGRSYDPADWIDPESVAGSILAAVDLPRDAEITDLTLRPGP